MEKVWEYLKQFPVKKAVTVALLVAGCLIAVKLLLMVFDKFVRRTKLDPLVCKILRIAVKMVLLFVAVIIILSSLGISVSSLVATLSVVGVAVSLAVQGFLSNVFGGIQIITNKPFHIGDFVDAGGESGIVREVGLFYTKLDTPDNKLIQVPNSAIANSNITNYSSEPNRRVDITVSASYDDDVEKVKAVLLQLMQEHPLVLTQEGLEPVAHVSAYNDSFITYTARAWCVGGDYWTVYFDLMDAIKPTFDQNGITISYPHMNVHMVKQ